MAVTIAGQALVSIPCCSGGPQSLIEEGAAGAAIRAASMVRALAFWMLKITDKKII